jgi:hypothetical protein
VQQKKIQVDDDETMTIRTLEKSSDTDLLRETIGFTAQRGTSSFQPRRPSSEQPRGTSIKVSRDERRAREGRGGGLIHE